MRFSSLPMQALEKKIGNRFIWGHAASLGDHSQKKNHDPRRDKVPYDGWTDVPLADATRWTIRSMTIRFSRGRSYRRLSGPQSMR